MKRPRLLVVTTSSETLVTILQEQISFLRKHFDVHLCCSKDAHYSDLLTMGVPVSFVGMHRGISPFRDLLSVISMIFVVARVKPDILHSYTPKAGLVAMLAGWLCRVPRRIHTFTGLIFPTSQGLRRRILVYSDMLVSLLSTVVVPESKGVRRDLAEIRVSRKLSPVIGNGNIVGVDTAYFDRNALGVASASGIVREVLSVKDGFVFCFVGRINKDKGVSELVQAFSYMPEKCELFIVGSLDYSSPPDSCVLDEIDSNQRIHCVGFQSDIRPYLWSSHILVLPSYREGFPNVVLQAMSMELPVISTDVSGANEVVLPGVTGWIVPPRDKDALLKVMLDAAATDLADLSEMGRRGRMLVSDRFERCWYQEQLLNFYRGLLN